MVRGLPRSAAPAGFLLDHTSPVTGEFGATPTIGLPTGLIANLRAVGSLRGNTAVSPTYTSGRGWRFHPPAQVARCVSRQPVLLHQHRQSAGGALPREHFAGELAGRVFPNQRRQYPQKSNMYLVEMRKRGNRVRVYSGSSNVLRFTIKPPRCQPLLGIADFSRTVRSSVSCCVWAMLGLMSPMRRLMYECRMAPQSPMAGSAAAE